MACSCKF